MASGDGDTGITHTSGEQRDWRKDIISKIRDRSKMKNNRLFERANALRRNTLQLLVSDEKLKNEATSSGSTGGSSATNILYARLQEVMEELLNKEASLAKSIDLNARLRSDVKRNESKMQELAGENQALRLASALLEEKLKKAQEENSQLVEELIKYKAKDPDKMNKENDNFVNLSEKIDDNEIIPETSSSDAETIVQDSQQESQSLIPNPYNRKTKSADSDLLPRSMSTDKNGENRSCKSDYKENLKSNLDISQSRNVESPLKSSAETESFETALGSRQVSAETVDSPKQVQDTTESSIAVLSRKSSTVDVETIILSDSAEESPLVASTSPQAKSKKLAVGLSKLRTPEKNNKKSGKKITPKSKSSRQSPENGLANGSSWIAPKDVQTQNSKSSNRVHPVTEFVETMNGKVPLLRINRMCRNGPNAPSSREKGPSKYNYEQSDTSKPGTSGVNSTKPGRICISSSDTDNDQAMQPVTRYNNRNISHSERGDSHKEQEHIYNHRNLISSESDDERETVTVKKRKMMKRNGRVHRTSDSSNEDEESTKTPNKSRRKSYSSDQTKNAKRNERVHRTAPSSDEDDEIAKNPNKSKRKSYSSDQTKNAKRNERVHQITPSSDDDDETAKSRNKSKRKSYSSDQTKNAKRKERVQRTTPSSDEDDGTAKALIKGKRKGYSSDQSKNAKRNERVHRITPSSDEDDESAKALNKSKRKGYSSDQTKNANRNDRVHQTTPPSDEDDGTAKALNKSKRKGYSSDQSKNAKRNERVHRITPSSDEVEEIAEIPSKGKRKSYFKDRSINAKTDKPVHHSTSQSIDEDEDTAKTPRNGKRKEYSSDRSKDANRYKRVHRIITSSDEDEEAARIRSKGKRKDYGSDKSLNTKRNKRVRRSSSLSSDEDEESARNSSKGSSNDFYSYEKIVKREKINEYARQRRSKLNEDIPTGYRRGRTFNRIAMHEQQQMVDYLCSHDDIILLHPKGFKVWHELLKTGKLKDRTAQSLQNHFSKILLPNIQNFFGNMSEKHKEQFKFLQMGGK